MPIMVHFAHIAPGVIGRRGSCARKCMFFMPFPVRKRRQTEYLRPIMEVAGPRD